MAKGNKEEYRLQNEMFLETIAREEGVYASRGGIYYKIIEKGSGGGTVGPRSIVTCHYKGSLINGKVFDNSFTRSCPEAFRVNELISGFQIALVNMSIGDHWIVYIPSNMGYGPKTSGPIPGNSTLIFEIKLISIG